MLEIGRALSRITSADCSLSILPRPQGRGFSFWCKMAENLLGGVMLINPASARREKTMIFRQLFDQTSVRIPIYSVSRPL